MNAELIERVANIMLSRLDLNGHTMEGVRRTAGYIVEALTRPDEATSTQEVGPVSFAWTAANGRPYPPYINLAGNRIRVRGEPSHGEVMPFTTGWIEGPYVSVELPDEAIEGLRQALSRRPADEVTRHERRQELI